MSPFDFGLAGNGPPKQHRASFRKVTCVAIAAALLGPLPILLAWVTYGPRFADLGQYDLSLTLLQVLSVRCAPYIGATGGIVGALCAVLGMFQSQGFVVRILARILVGALLVLWNIWPFWS